MTSFWMLVAAMLIVAMLFIVVPLWRRSMPEMDVLRDEANLGILRDQSAELEKDLRNGLLTQEAYELGMKELQTRLVEEVRPEARAEGSARNPSRILAIVLAVMLPVLAVPLYLTIGNTEALTPQEAIVAGDDGVIQSDEALERLAKRVGSNGKNPNEWWMMARSYSQRERYADAADAYQHLVDLVPNVAQLWADYADVYAMAHGRTLQNPEVAKLINKALDLDGTNATALALSGSAAMERGDYYEAILRWQALVDGLDPGSPEIPVFQGGIQQAKEQLATQPGGKDKLAKLALTSQKPTVDASKAVSGKVSLSPALASKVLPSDTVFILARAANGPPMPLAVIKRQVKDLPMEFTLDDSMAMQPQLKLSGFGQVMVVARVSKSGTPMARPGDLQAISKAVKPGTKGLKVVIDTVVE